MTLLRANGLGLAAISFDSREVLGAFSQRRGITFPLLSDQDSETITRYLIRNTGVPTKNLVLIMYMRDY